MWCSDRMGETVSGSLYQVARTLKDELLKIGDIISRRSSQILVDIDNENLPKVLSQHRVAVILFTAEWCGRCILMQDILTRIASRLFRDDIVFGRVDVDRAFSLAERYGVQHIPTTLIIVEGRVVDALVGSVSEEKLLERINRELTDIEKGGKRIAEKSK
ncbi:thioredoxin [Aeropyrum pernix K1]|uniref:Thioredoxin n=1 Tax=Aeropyrum pernix (strain ATCC 700893 / DSM 11879 / JCM 9820 / NBRC 100138 / K1) TaxID=272557 RepID=Q9Y955_AERPE|nr:thioredoxin family protein [Aeropyrum pernix]BAA81445.2 thioredoxin [Aeropyrum pernix K1]